MKKLIVLIFAITANFCYCQEPKSVWINNFGSEGADELKCLTIDKEKNIIVGGYFSKEIDLGGKVIKANGEQDILLIKFNQYGKLIWAQQAGSDYSEKDHICELVSKIVTDSKGNIIVAGTFQAHAIFQDTSILSNGNIDIFIAKYSPNGELVWVNNIGNENADLIFDFKIDNRDNLYLSGYHHDERDKVVSSKIFITSIASDGNMNWFDEVEGFASSGAIEFVDEGIMHNLYLDNYPTNAKKSNENTSFYSYLYTRGGLRDMVMSNRSFLNYIESKSLSNTNNNIFTTSYGKILTFKYLNQFQYLDETVYSKGNWYHTAVIINDNNGHQLGNIYNVNGTINDLCITDSSLYIVGTYNVDNDISDNYLHYGFVDFFILNSSN